MRQFLRRETFIALLARQKGFRFALEIIFPRFKIRSEPLRDPKDVIPDQVPDDEISDLVLWFLAMGGIVMDLLILFVFEYLSATW